MPDSHIFLLNQGADLIRKIYIEEKFGDSPFTEKILAGFPQAIPREKVENASEIYKIINSSPDPVQAGKEVLFLTSNKGAFVKECPGTTHYKCCGYKILHIGTFCVMDCSYCILQTFFHPPLLQFFLNQDEMVEELKKKVFDSPKISRVGTGEYTDSLIWDYWTDLPQFLVRQFSEQDKAVLELKTKTTSVDSLSSLDHKRKTIISWSINTPRIIASDEKKTSSLESRLEAARKCAEWGYPLAFHFDPLIIYDGCEKEYEDTINKLFNAVPFESVAYISLGSFRFMPPLKQIIQKRFPDSRIVYGEFIQGMDGKMRYFKPLRMELYKKITGYIRKNAPDACVYFCMEDEDIWREVMGFVPSEPDGISDMLDESVKKLCGLRAR